MSAEVLRRAAALMRERAEAASDGPYIAAEQTHDQWYGLQTPFAAIGNVFDCRDASHIASWHPAVALAVADWLDEVVDLFDADAGRANDDYEGEIDLAAYESGWFHHDPALAVARAYLGVSS